MIEKINETTLEELQKESSQQAVDQIADKLLTKTDSKLAGHYKFIWKNMSRLEQDEVMGKMKVDLNDRIRWALESAISTVAADAL